jgi:type I restriction enzyme, S subunit
MRVPAPNRGDKSRRLTVAALCEGGLFTDGDWITTADQDQSGEVRLIQLADIGDGVFRDRSSRFLSRSRAVELRCTFVKPGDVLVARMPDPVGRACLVPASVGNAVVAVDITIVRPRSDSVDAEWLMMTLNSPQARKQIQAHVRGTTRQRISRTNLGKIEVHAPALAEQRAIASAFSAADAAAQALELHMRRSQDRLTALREWVPTGAARGALGGVHQPDEEPHASAVAVKSSSELPWPTTSLSSLLLDARYGTAKKSGYDLAGTPVLRIPNVVGGSVDLRDLKRTDLTARENDSLALEPSDLLMVRSNGSVRLLGRTARVTPQAVGMAFAGYLIRLRPNAELVDADYLQLALSARPVREQIERPARSSAGVHNLNLSEIRALTVPLPPRSMQVEVARRAGILIGRLDALHQVIESARSSCSAARRALHASVFDNRLLPSGDALKALTGALPREAASPEAQGDESARAQQSVSTWRPSSGPATTTSGLVDALARARGPRTPEELFDEAGSDSGEIVDAVEAFYAALRVAQADGVLREYERHPGSADVLIVSADGTDAA